ncbi:MAG: hypothetical protein GEU74_06240 [Nitriliruptorales bacterium]|nr:hypothetical protein [Nitriliruptorales bacterium]
MDVIKRRALWGWVVGLLVLAGIFLWATAARPTVPGASAGAIARLGLVSVIVLLPALLAARTISKFTMDNTVAAVLLPIAMGVFVGLVVVMIGFTPEGTKLCSAFERHGFEPDPACYTSTATRVQEFAEGVATWLVFGLALLGSFRLRERRAQRLHHARSRA